MHRAFQDAIWNAEQFFTRSPGSTGAVAPEADAQRRFELAAVVRKAYGEMPVKTTELLEAANVLERPAPADTGQGGRVGELEAALRHLRDAFLSRHGCFPLDRVTADQQLWNSAMSETYELVGSPGAALDAGART